MAREVSARPEDRLSDQPAHRQIYGPAMGQRTGPAQSADARTGGHAAQGRLQPQNLYQPGHAQPLADAHLYEILAARAAAGERAKSGIQISACTDCARHQRSINIHRSFLAMEKLYVQCVSQVWSIFG